MAEFTQFEASTPEVQAATEEKVYDLYWLANFRIQAGNPLKPAKMIASFAPARNVTIQVPVLDEEGNVTGSEDKVVKELKANTEPKRLVINDLFGAAEEDPTLATALETVLIALKAKAIAEGIL